LKGGFVLIYREQANASSKDFPPEVKAFYKEHKDIIFDSRSTRLPPLRKITHDIGDGSYSRRKSAKSSPS